MTLGWDRWDSMGLVWCFRCQFKIKRASLLISCVEQIRDEAHSTQKETRAGHKEAISSAASPLIRRSYFGKTQFYVSAAEILFLSLRSLKIMGQRKFTKNKIMNEY